MKDAIFYPLKIGSIDRAITKSHGLSYRLTPDVLQEATRRLGFMSLFILASFLCVFISNELAHFGNIISGNVTLDKPKYLLFILLWILSGILFLYFYCPPLSDCDRRIFSISPWLEVVLAGCLAFLVNLQLDWSLDPSQIKQTPVGIFETNLVSAGTERLKAGIEMSASTQKRIRALHERVNRAVEDSIRTLVENDTASAAAVVMAKAEINEMATDAESHLSTRLVADDPHRLTAFRIESELIEYLKRVYYFSKRVAKIVTCQEIENGSFNNEILP